MHHTVRKRGQRQTKGGFKEGKTEERMLKQIPHSYRWSWWSFPSRAGSCWRRAMRRWRTDQWRWTGFGWCRWTGSSAAGSLSDSAASCRTEGPALPPTESLTGSHSLSTCPHKSVSLFTVHWGLNLLCLRAWCQEELKRWRQVEFNHIKMFLKTGRKKVK